MTPDEERVKVLYEKAITQAKAPLLEDLHTLTRALADEHRRVDVAVAARHESEKERNRLQATVNALTTERISLNGQITQLHTQLKGTKT